MVIEVLITLVIVFFIVYKFLGNDIFAPGILVCLSYIMAFICAYVNVDYWKIDLSKITVLYLLSGIIIFILGNCLVYFFIRPKLRNRAKMPKLDISQLKPYTISKISMIFIIIYDVIAVFIYYLEVRRIGGDGSFTVMMNNFRQRIMFGGQSVSPIVNQLIRLVTASAIMCIYYFSYNVFAVKQKIKDNLFLMIPVAINIIKIILTSGRYEFLEIAIEFIILYAIFYYKINNSRMKINPKLVFIAIISIFGLLFVFYSVKEMVGRTSNQDVVDYISSYFGGSIELFDLYMKEYDGPTSENFGVLTFAKVYKYLVKFLGFDVTFGTASEFRRSVNGILVGNVYTSFRAYVQDFGYWGLVILTFISSIIWSIFYYKALLTRSAFTKVVYAYTSYGLILHSYSEQFFSIFLSLDVWMILALVYITHLYFTRVRIKA